MKAPRFPVVINAHSSDEPESCDSPGTRRRYGISFPVAFLLVLGLHCAGIAGIYAYSNIKPKPAMVSAAEPAEPVHGPKSDALAANEWLEPDAKPQVVATPPPVQVAKPSATPVIARPKVAPPPVQRVVEATPTSPRKVSPSASREESVAQTAASQDLRQQFLAATGKVETSRSKSAPTSPVKAPAAPVAVRAKSAEPTIDSKPSVASAAAVPPSAPKSAPAAAAKAAVAQYTLAPGDNLYMVSRKLGVSYQDLTRANGISDPGQLRVGQTLKVPAVVPL